MTALGQKLRNARAGFQDIMHFDNRWEVALRRILFRDTGIITYRKNGMEMVVDHHAGDENGVRACLVSPMYRCLLPAMKLEGPLKVLDIGANGGGFALMLADAGYTLGKVVAIEMNPRVFARMQLNIVQNLDVGAELINGAISGESEVIEADFGRGSTGESIAGSGAHVSEGTVRKTRIQGLTFDQIFERGFAPDEVVDLCKIDVEGSEYDVFAKGHCARLRQCRYLVIEIHPIAGASQQSVVAAIEQFGFEEMPRPAGGEADVYCFANRSLTR